MHPADAMKTAVIDKIEYSALDSYVRSVKGVLGYATVNAIQSAVTLLFTYVLHYILLVDIQIPGPKCLIYVRLQINPLLALSSSKYLVVAGKPMLATLLYHFNRKFTGYDA